MVPAGLTIGGVTGGPGIFLTLSMPDVLPPGQSTTVTTSLVSTKAGPFTIQTELASSNVADPDSTPNNGFTNGEDDTAQVLIRVR